MIKAYSPDAPEVRAFRERIYEDLGLDPKAIETFDILNRISNDPLAYWYSDQKFLNNGFDQILIYHWDGEPAGLAGGTLYSKDLYRGTQMYYILKKFRRTRGCNTFAGRPGGFIETQVDRARELGCKAYFLTMHTYDKAHERFWEGLKRDRIINGFMPARERSYSAKDFVFPNKDYTVMHVPQKMAYIDLTEDGIDFDELWNDT